MARALGAVLVISVAAAIDYLAFAKGIFNASEAVAVGSITSMLGAVWWKSKSVNNPPNPGAPS
jgi:hypothetical protein